MKLKHYMHNGLSFYQNKYCKTTFLAMPHLSYIISNRPVVGKTTLLRPKSQQTRYYYKIASKRAKAYQHPDGHVTRRRPFLACCPVSETSDCRKSGLAGKHAASLHERKLCLHMQTSEKKDKCGVYQAGSICHRGVVQSLNRQVVKKHSTEWRCRKRVYWRNQKEILCAFQLGKSVSLNKSFHVSLFILDKILQNNSGVTNSLILMRGLQFNGRFWFRCVANFARSIVYFVIIS